MTPIDEQQVIDVGPTVELSLRVSVATLARVVFPNPEDGKPMLALEHKATLLPGDDESQVVVKAQPLGGTVRILNPSRLHMLVDGFHFDSKRSRSEQDFRIFIRPADWEVVREFCLRKFSQDDGLDLESDPVRELVEEFDDAMGIEFQPDQYALKPAGIVLENEPASTGNVHALGIPTVRIYRVFEVQIADPALCRAMVAKSESHSKDVLRSLALNDARKGGRGRANAMLAVPMQQIQDAYLAIPPEKRDAPLPFKNTHLDGNVPAVLEGIFVPKYRHLGQ
jgi:hypothetical protein